MKKYLLLFSKKVSFAPGVDNGICGKLGIVMGAEEDIKTVM